MRSRLTAAAFSMRAGFDLMNEPRDDHAKPARELQAWVEEMSAFVKRMAPYQLVTVGDEGFYQPSLCQADECGAAAAS